MRLTEEPMPFEKLPVLLATKVLPPRLPTGLIDRPRLFDLVTQAENRRLTVIKAPAGFGKTSLAITWLNQLRASGARVAWLSLDDADDEPARFIHHLAQSLRHACSSVGVSAIGLTAETSLVPAHSIMSTLINELAEVEDEVFIFLDDYHLISLPAIHDAMSFFIANAPSHVHVIVCTRADPALPLARLRAQNELLEVDASTLRFNFDETQRFVERECPGRLGTSGVKSLHATTEGWAAALRISASVLSREEPRPGSELSVPSGASRPFAAYLEDMLRRLPDDMVAFMLRTAILDRLTAPLCQAVTGVKASQGMLEAIAARQLLLEPMDLEGHWFRYHPLLGEYLRQRLGTQSGDELAELHRRACRWYASQEIWTDAVRHAIAAGDTDDAITLIGNCAMALVKKGDLLTLLGWQRHFPAHLMRGQVDVTLAIAWGMALAMRFDDALAMLDTIGRDVTVDATPEHDNIRWECQAIRSVVTALQDDPQTALTMAQGCLDRPSTDIWTTNVVSNVVRFGHWKAGDLKDLYATPWIPYSIEEDQRNVFSSVYRLCLLGLAEMQQMHFALAERYFVESARLAEYHAGPQSASAALCAPMIAQIRYEEGRLDEAEALIVDLMPVVNVAVMVDGVLIAYLLLVRIAVSRANTEQAYSLLDQAQTLGYARQWDRLIAVALVERTRLYLAEGRMTEASACVVQLERLTAAYSNPRRSNSAEIANYCAVGAAFVAMAHNRMQDAVALLSKVLQSLESRHSDYHALRVRTAIAVAWLGANERARAVEVFRDVLKVAAPAGMYRTILDQGPEIGTLLHAVREDTRCTAQTKELLAYIDHLLEGWRARYQPESRQIPGAERESLSARERNILELIAEGQSNKEIARTLGIAPETVKSHVKSIFMKLDVDKRAHAVARAQGLGLVGIS
ncbi:LuxR C-terminal-related transcriptional regulator [Caballeronia sp. SEWSISQ10-4 2]|uniref:LuxR C-terminal-related transcriptional regulator n=1 Tax=Caballeronia sp. SEWSISQ10-4 2 TaxID=2937438 RepID=UPI002656C15D|nr:LuxR C-terminal-related transcriptional regulator [Caballeronia sp. SEWSISQ10-4 2]MDN7177372.1 LuxR C-terminal-related transcriptional regulator [Caballeronia sp. SEWSISQ10-4 2]